MDEPLPRARLIVGRCPGQGETVLLMAEEASHARARRLAVGDPVTLVDGSGVEARARLLKLSRSGGEAVVEQVIAAERKGTEIDLLVAGLRLDRLSWLAEKATEFAVARLVLVETARTQRFRASASVIARLLRVAREAAKQGEQAFWPQVSGPVTLDDALRAVEAPTKLFLDLAGRPFPSRLSGAAAILVGPEGGWTRAERAAAREKGWSPVALPAGKLRAETAAVAALVLARAALARGSRAEGGRRKGGGEDLS